MMKKVALSISALIFLVISFMHFLRYAKGWEIVIDRFSVPLDWSIYGGVVALLLSIWMFVASK